MNFSTRKAILATRNHFGSLLSSRAKFGELGRLKVKLGNWRVVGLLYIVWAESSGMWEVPRPPLSRLAISALLRKSRPRSSKSGIVKEKFMQDLTQL